MIRCAEAEAVEFARPGRLAEKFERVAKTLYRYDNVLTNRFIRLLHELDELQTERRRKARLLGAMDTGTGL